jgi:hypothetical protein
MRLFVCSLLGWFACLPMSLADEPKMRVHSLHFSPDGALLAAAAGENGQPGKVVIWDVQTGAPMHELSFQASRIVRFASDSKTLAVADAKNVHFLDVATGKSKSDGDLTHPRNVVAIAFGPAGKLATAAAGGVVRVWDVTNRKELATTPIYREGFIRLAFSPDGKWLAGADQQQAYQWDTVTGKEVRKFDGGPTAGAVFSADSALLLRCVGGKVVVNDCASGILRSTATLMWGYYFDFAPACEVAAATDVPDNSDPIVAVQTLRFSPPTETEHQQIDQLLKKLDADDIEVREAAGEGLLRLGWLVEPILAKEMADSTSAEVRLRARKLHTQLTKRGYNEIAAPEGQITSIALSGDGKQLVVGGLTGAVHILGVPDGKIIRTLRISKP